MTDDTKTDATMTDDAATPTTRMTKKSHTGTTPKAGAKDFETKPKLSAEQLAERRRKLSELLAHRDKSKAKEACDEIRKADHHDKHLRAAVFTAIRAMPESKQARRKSMFRQALRDQPRNPKLGANKTITKPGKPGKHERKPKVRKPPFRVQLPASSSSSSPPPWLLHTSEARAICDTTKPAMERLDAEIVEFMKFSQATQKETARRADVAEFMKTSVKAIWPESDTQLFGSCSTGLTGAGTDVDVTILKCPVDAFKEDNVEKPTKGQVKGARKALYKFLSDIARHCNKSTDFKIDYPSAEVVPMARVPILKFKLKCGTPVDVAFNQTNGLKTSRTVAKYLSEHGEMAKPLFYVIKALLQQSSVADSSCAGLGSYALFNMIVHHIQRYSINFADKKKTPSNLLLDFFALYDGKSNKAFNFKVNGISICNGGEVFKRSDRFEERNVVSFSIQDPDTPENNVGKSCAKIVCVQKVFALVGERLTKFVQSDNMRGTPLGSVVSVTDGMSARRAPVLESISQDGGGGLLRSLKDVVEWPHSSFANIKDVGKEEANDEDANSDSSSMDSESDD